MIRKNLPLRRRAYFPSSLVGLFRPPSACRKIIPAGRKRTERRERKTRLNDELQQTDIVGGERGGHRNGGKNPRTGPQSHGKGEGDAVPLFRLRGHQGSAEHRNGQPPAGQHGGADEPPAEGPANSRRRRRDNVSQADGQPQGLCPHGLLHAAVPRGCRSAADTRRIHGVRPADALAARTERGHRRLPARSPARHPPLRL